MSGNKARHPTLFDGVVFVATSAIGLGTVNALSETRGRVSGSGGSGQLAGFVEPTGWVLAAWTLGWFIVRLRSPRPSWRRLARRPAFTACLATGAGLMIGVASAIPEIAAAYRSDSLAGPGDLVRFLTRVATPGAIAPYIAAVWLVLATSGRWRTRDDDWLERLGRFLALLWLVAAAAVSILRSDLF